MEAMARRGWPTVGLSISVALVLLVAGLVPATLAFHEGTPIVLELEGNGNEAWAVAIRSHDEATSHRGNELVLRLWANAPYERSIASMGIFEISEGEGGELTELRRGAIGTTFRGQDEIHIEPLADRMNQASIDEDRQASIVDDEGVLAEMKEGRSMDPGEWRYFVVWAGGSESSTLQLRGEGYTVEGVVQGKAHVLGNDELIEGGGIHAHKSASLPPGISAGDRGHAGVGITSVSDTGIALETEAPILGMFNEYHTWHLCTWVPVSGCIPVGHDLNAAASRLQDGGFANISMETPSEGHVSNVWDIYVLAPGSWGDAWHSGREPGTYSFEIDQLTSVSGPSYREPVEGQGARLNGEQLVLSIAEVDYTELGDAG